MLALLPTLTQLGKAQSNSTIADTVKKADGSAFNGTVVITWTGGTASVSGNPVPYSTSVKIYNGTLSVSLVPTVAYSAYYVAVFNSADGKTSWVENWQVGPSASPLTLAQVRTTLSTTNPAPGTTTVSMGQVVGLNSYLNALSTSFGTVSSTIGSMNSTVVGLNNSVSNLTDLVNIIQASANTSTAGTLIEGETPAGTINGTNASFTIATTPTTTSSVMVFRNGILQSPAIDFTVTGKTISFSSASLPQTGDNLQVSYRVGTPSATTTFVDNEAPLGSINGSNLTFTLANMPTSGTLRLYRNGALLQSSTDYNLNGATITFVSSVATPGSGDSLSAYYRVTNQTP
jgi:hypothetical protein